jgi:hypothetical protein
MKKYFTLFLSCLVLSIQHCLAQAGMWTWISGSATLGSAGVYGTQGVPSVNNHPPGAYECVEWKDKQGNFWLYGGTYPRNSDLWKYDPVTNEWTWVKGSGLSNQSPVYGTLGVPDPANTPGERGFGSISMTDTSGNLWLFGGFPRRNDLWKYTIGTNEWTWISGSTAPFAAGVHGTQGIPSTSNVPGARSEVASGWADAQNNLWIFGGDGYDGSGSSGVLNDLMRFNIATNEWTWMKGSTVNGAAPAYGIKGVPAPANDPGARWSYTKWKDLQGKFWLTGGDAFGMKNDTWRYDDSVNEWTWMSGPAAMNHPGVYTATCIFDTVNIPAGRLEHRSSVTDECGRFWMFGGVLTHPGNALSDLWVFDPVQLKWNWQNGSNVPNQSGSYGTLGVPAPANHPPSRAGAVAWWGNDSRFYMYGGMHDNTVNSLGDLWVFTPDSACIAACVIIPVAAFSAPNSICPGTCTDFVNLSVNAISYQWSFPGAVPSSSTAANPQNICYPNPGSYDVVLIASSASGADTLLLANYMTVYPTPSPQGITQNGDTLFAIPGAASYQWYFNTVAIAGATDYFYVAQTGGDYNVVATDANGCEVEAVIFNVVAGTYSIADGALVTVFPTPGSEKLFIASSENIIQLKIIDFIGKELFSIAVNDDNARIDISSLAYGIYFLHIRTGQGVVLKRLIKE